MNQSPSWHCSPTQLTKVLVPNSAKRQSRSAVPRWFNPRDGIQPLGLIVPFLKCLRKNTEAVPKQEKKSVRPFLPIVWGYLYTFQSWETFPRDPVVDLSYISPNRYILSTIHRQVFISQFLPSGIRATERIVSGSKRKQSELDCQLWKSVNSRQESNKKQWHKNGNFSRDATCSLLHLYGSVPVPDTQRPSGTLLMWVVLWTSIGCPPHR